MVGLRPTINRDHGRFYHADGKLLGVHFKEPSCKHEILSCDIEARDAQARGCKYSLAKESWLTASVATLITLGFVFLYVEYPINSAAMAVPKKGSY